MSIYIIQILEFSFSFQGKGDREAVDRIHII